MNMLRAEGLPHSTIPTVGTNVLSDLHEFVITIITYATLVKPDGTTETVPCYQTIKG